MKTTARIDQQHAQDVALFYEVLALTELLADWDLAIYENAARDILAELAQQDAPTPVSEPWWAKYIPLAALVGVAATFAPLFVF